jgi:hypothetical protein
LDSVAAQTAMRAAKAIEESEKKLQGELDARNKTYDEIIAKWNGYGFTSTEKDSLKNPKGGTKKVSGGLFKKAKTVQQSILNVIKGNKEVNINIEWLPTVLDKGKIVGPDYPKGGLFNLTTASKKLKDKYTEYYGGGKSKDEYDTLNKDRKAELLSLAEQIEEIEAQKGTTL